MRGFLGVPEKKRRCGIRCPYGLVWRHAALVVSGTLPKGLYPGAAWRAHRAGPGHTSPGPAYLRRRFCQTPPAELPCCCVEGRAGALLAAAICLLLPYARCCRQREGPRRSRPRAFVVFGCRRRACTPGASFSSVSFVAFGLVLSLLSVVVFVLGDRTTWATHFRAPGPPHDCAAAWLPGASPATMLLHQLAPTGTNETNQTLRDRGINLAVDIRPGYEPMFWQPGTHICGCSPW